MKKSCFLSIVACVLALVLCGVPTKARADDLYAAIAFSTSTLRYGYSWGKSSRAAAEQAAIRGAKSSDARIVIWSRNSWCALARSNDGSGWGAAHAPTEAAACEKALDNCPNYGGTYIACTVFSGK